jgi:hypothetical protein
MGCGATDDGTIVWTEHIDPKSPTMPADGILDDPYLLRTASPEGAQQTLHEGYFAAYFPQVVSHYVGWTRSDGHPVVTDLRSGGLSPGARRQRPVGRHGLSKRRRLRRGGPRYRGDGCRCRDVASSSMTTTLGAERPTTTPAADRPGPGASVDWRRLHTPVAVWGLVACQVAAIGTSLGSLVAGHLAEAASGRLVGVLAGPRSSEPRASAPPSPRPTASSRPRGATSRGSSGPARPRQHQPGSRRR